MLPGVAAILVAMQIPAGDMMLDTEQLSEEVAAQLFTMVGGTLAEPTQMQPTHLLFPVKRDTTTRVSEQESKAILTQCLEVAGYYYSVETPTTETYQMSGSREMSARTDVTVYGSADPGDRVCNVELKAGKPKMESFRKDFEKLLREGLPGLWFHTLATATVADWVTLEDKVRDALSRRPDDPHTGLPDPKDLTGTITAAEHKVHFVFCVLDARTIARNFTIDFAEDWEQQLTDGFRAVSEPEDVASRE